MIVERVKAGLARARAKGAVLGRPKVSAKKRAEVLKLRRDGLSVRKIAKVAGLAPGTVQKIKANPQGEGLGSSTTTISRL